MEPAPAGWTRFILKSKFGAGRDFRVLDLDDNQQYLVDGKMGVRPRADVQDSTGAVRYTVKGQMLAIPKKMSISDANGSEVASIKAKAFSFVKDKMVLTMATGPDWHVAGSLVEKDYSIDSDGRPIAAISQKWLTVRDSYTLDVADGTDPALALAVVWVIDRWVERD